MKLHKDPRRWPDEAKTDLLEREGIMRYQGRDGRSDEEIRRDAIESTRRSWEGR